jgi:hypothetical protein
MLGLIQTQLSTGDYALIITSTLCYHGSLDTWRVIQMTAVKFKHFTFSVLGFALSNLAKILLFMILNDFCLIPAKCCYVIAKVRNLVGQMHIANRCLSQDIANGAQIPISQTLQLQQMDFCLKFPRERSINYYRSNQGSAESQLNVRA